LELPAFRFSIFAFLKGQFQMRLPLRLRFSSFGFRFSGD